MENSSQARTKQTVGREWWNKLGHQQTLTILMNLKLLDINAGTALWTRIVLPAWLLLIQSSINACRTNPSPNAWSKNQTLRYWFQEKVLQRHHNIPSDSGIEHQVKTSHPWNLNCWKANRCRPSTLAHICEHGSGLCAHRRQDWSELMSNNDPIGKHVVESFGWSRLRIARQAHAVALGE